ncbi:MAG TPA: methyltransferase [Actinophytocola sp.]|nr:methyltransferase [Actinophytocola sp.]
MTARDDDTASRVVTAYDWGALGDVLDVGGGDGTLLIALLNEYPSLRGRVLDLPETAEAARKRIEAAGLEDRAGAVAGDFFAELPPGAEGYLLAAVLREWGDDDARRILRRCAEAAGGDGAVFVIESVAAGAARDLAALTALAESAGLTVENVHDGNELAVLELNAP